MPPRIDNATVRHIANLARISLTDEQAARCGEQLSRILDAFNQLSQIDTSGVEPTAHPLDAHSVLREDVPVSPPGAEAILANAPRAEAGCFALPKVLEQGAA